LNDISAWLVFVCFVNDTEMHGPKSESEWQSAIEDIHKHLGLDPKRQEPFVVDLFIDVNKFA
jgi:hypothetical protein